MILRKVRVSKFSLFAIFVRSSRVGSRKNGYSLIARKSDIAVEGPAVSPLARKTELFARGFWSMLLKAAVEPDLLVDGEPRSTYRPVASAENSVYSRPNGHTCIIATIERVP